MEPTIKPIETVYQGYRFRSRLEARWAVFFDTAGIRWEYEKEGFELSDGTRYLPDFWLPDLNCWVEIKPEGASDEQAVKVYQFADSVRSQYLQDRNAARNDMSGRAALAEHVRDMANIMAKLNSDLRTAVEIAEGLGFGETVERVWRLVDVANELEPLEVAVWQAAEVITPYPDLPPAIYLCQGSPYRIGRNYAYTLVELFPTTTGALRCWGERADGNAGPLVNAGDDHEYSARMAAAYKAAQQARFEHGERGRRS